MRQAALVGIVALVAGCGARTGLGIDEDVRAFDAGPRDAGRDAFVLDAPAADAPDAPDGGRDAPPIDGCMVVTIALEPIPAEVLLVIDRSTSMGWALTGPGGPGASRWQILGDALRAELPGWDASTDLGALLFPDGTMTCSTRTTPDLTPRPDGSGAVLSLVAASGPGGRTPTASAMRAAFAYFDGALDPSRPQAVVLATDGAPNCNGGLDPRTCRCTGGAGLPVGCDASELCLDDVATNAAISELLAIGVPTYVIGIDGDPDPAVSRVLTSMANAGGRPNPVDPGRAYYSVRRPGDLGAALSAIESSIARCSLALDDVAPTGRPSTVTIDGVVVPLDPTNGWQPAADGRIELFGRSCDLAQDGADHTIELVVDC